MPNPPSPKEPERFVSEEGSGLTIAAPLRVPGRHGSPASGGMSSTSICRPSHTTEVAENG